MCRYFLSYVGIYCYGILIVLKLCKLGRIGFKIEFGVCEFELIESNKVIMYLNYSEDVLLIYESVNCSLM